MNRFISVLIFFYCLSSMLVLNAQTDAIPLENILSFEEYLGYVKKHHPLMKQAKLTLTMGEANLLKARGGFDPKIEVDYDRKKFKDTEYYDQLNAAFKIPTWYGIELKANFEENTGAFLDPSLTVPDNGLYSAGISFSAAQGLLINDRMADLKKAKFFLEQSKADQDLLVNNLLFEASKAYLDWLQFTNEQQIYASFVENAETRLNAVTRSSEVGETAAIDITEARITYQNRLLNLEEATLKQRKAALYASNFLWIDNVPLEIEENVQPEAPLVEAFQLSLALDDTNANILLEEHPKLRSLDAKIGSLTVDRRLKRNRLLPKVDLQYNFLSTEYDQVSSFNTANYKAFVNISIPLFLRKERGDLRLANLKLQDANFERNGTTLSLQNKITAARTEINSLGRQNELVKEIVEDYRTLVAAEERKFSLGESSLFLINSREQKLIDASLKENEITVKRLEAIATLYNVLGISEEPGENFN